MGRAWKMPEGLFFLDKSKGEEDRAKVSEDSFSRLLQPPLLSLSLSFPRCQGIDLFRPEFILLGF